EHEARLPSVDPLRIVLVIRTLPPPDVKAKVERAEEERHHRYIADEDVTDPSNAECPQRLDRRCEEEPDDRGNAGEEDPPRQEVAGISENPFQHRARLRRE